jgi:hypothetical protein
VRKRETGDDGLPIVFGSNWNLGEIVTEIINESEDGLAIQSMTACRESQDR